MICSYSALVGYYHWNTFTFSFFKPQKETQVWLRCYFFMKEHFLYKYVCGKKNSLALINKLI